MPSKSHTTQLREARERIEALEQFNAELTGQLDSLEGLIAQILKEQSDLQAAQKDNRNFANIALRNLLTLLRWAYPAARATDNKFTAELKAGGVQVKACFPEYR